MIDARIKSLFLLPAITTSVVLCVIAGAMILRGEPDRLAWSGAFLAGLPLPLIVARLMALKIARSAENEPLALLATFAGLFLAAWEFLFEGASDWRPLVVAVAGALLLLLYVFWYSRYGRVASGKLDVGNILPQFSLRDADGAPVDSHDLLGAPAVLVFYPGNWCALSRAQIAELGAREQEFARLGINVVLISPQTGERSRELSTRLQARFRFWVDQGNQVAEALQICVRNGVPFGVAGDYPAHSVMPTVVVTNAHGTILYADQTDNYRVRPEPDIFIAILRRAGVIESAVAH
jgi:peroxiredoxin/energy-converting hydrogenase Eha subunit A